MWEIVQMFFLFTFLSIFSKYKVVKSSSYDTVCFAYNT